MMRQKSGLRRWIILAAFDDDAQAGEDATVRGGCGCGGLQLIDHPWLTADLGGEPTAKHGDKTGGKGQECTPEKPARRL